MRFLANENTPREAVLAARAAGYDVSWIVEEQPGADDAAVLRLARQQERVLLTFDKDFGEYVFRQGRDGSQGIVLLRPRLRSPQVVTQFTLSVLSQPIEWIGHFIVAREGLIRVVPLP